MMSSTAHSFLGSRCRSANCGRHRDAPFSVTFLRLLVAFEPCFHAPSYRTFSLLVAGWIHCQGRRTITAVAVASGGVDRCHISVFHRFFSRATWSLDGVGQVVFRLTVRWIPA